MSRIQFARGFLILTISPQLASIAFGQMSPEEAESRLRARETAAQAAATQPASITNGDLTALQGRIVQLQAENTALRKQLAAFAIANPTSKPTASPVDPKVSTFTSRVLLDVLPTLRGEPNLTSKEENDDLNGAKNEDEKIAAFAALHKLSDEMTNAMYEGTPSLGMTEDCLKVFANVRTVSEDIDGKMLTLQRKDTVGREWTVWTGGGVVVRVDHPDTPALGYIAGPYK